MKTATSMAAVQRWCMRLAILLLAHASGAVAADNLVRIQQVEVVLSEVGPVVLLKAENRAIPVFIDTTVAQSIHAALTGGKTPRPYTHDLMHSVLSAYDGRVTSVMITLKGNTFVAAITVVLRDATKVFDSRASDAVALATHFKAPIMVPRELLETQGKALDAPPGKIKPPPGQLKT
ncbi:MAG: bifunctional nuclease family protein [Betaproteobacteria bacterium]|nr:bifunctional nuclease family protein [Betaproteobacteria bacterium]